ncbi:MAG: hypothetical protein IPP69_12470 [Flavobacteriales bacterium]|nr:hypothetical protein [Flavobacteriales bacterium]
MSTTSISAGDDVVFDAVHDIALDNINYLYVAGSYTSSTEGKNIRIARFDTDFESYWVHDFNGSDDLDDEALSIEVHGTSYVYVAGYSTSATTGKDIYAVKMTATGATVSWEDTYDLNGGDDVGNYLALDNSNSPIIGATTFKNGNDDIAVVGIKSTTGAINYQNRYNSEYNKNDRADCVAVDQSNGSLYVAGRNKSMILHTLIYSLNGKKNNLFTSTLRWLFKLCGIYKEPRTS